jgi:hypothetical protein
MLIPNDFAQINWKFTGAAAPTGAEVTLGVSRELFAGGALEAANLAAGEWVDEILPQQSTAITLASVLVKFGPNTTGQSAELAVGSIGGDGGVADPPNIALLVRKVTGVGGRSGRGRMFVPGWAGTAFDSSGDFNPARIGPLNLKFEALRAGLVALGLVPVLLHSAGSPIAAPMPITALQVAPRGATQRRRLRR